MLCDVARACITVGYAMPCGIAHACITADYAMPCVIAHACITIACITISVYCKLMRRVIVHACCDIVAAYCPMPCVIARAFINIATMDWFIPGDVEYAWKPPGHCFNIR